ncbi:MAG: erythromycin esterase family protein [Planctomycetota bacterium]|nr:erythromycin esterase family protein [Planctomycetota bacterium]
MRELLPAALSIVLVAACATTPKVPQDLDGWLMHAAVPLESIESATAKFVEATREARVIGLGEATHGQHEAFDLKREFTLALVRDGGVRVVAFEASASRARACDAYVSGSSDDLEAAIKGLGMLIWAVEENAQLLRDLRAWNLARPERERVRFVGVDVQDPNATVARLTELLGPSAGELPKRLADWAARLEPAVGELLNGKPEAYLQLRTDFEALERDVRAASDAPELALRLAELSRAHAMFQSAGGRDRAMAEMLLLQLGPDERAVVWAHNLHVTRGPLDYAGTPETGMGGCLAETLGSRYYALGFAFGEGEFQALDRTPEGKWIFRSWRVPAAPADALEHVLARALGRDAWLDLRGAPTSGPIAEWLDSSLGFRCFGGYRIPEGIEQPSADTSEWLRTVPRRDFDGWAFHTVTSAARPRR